MECNAMDCIPLIRIRFQNVSHFSSRQIAACVRGACGHGVVSAARVRLLPIVLSPLSPPADLPRAPRRPTCPRPASAVSPSHAPRHLAICPLSLSSPLFRRLLSNSSSLLQLIFSNSPSLTRLLLSRLLRLIFSPSSSQDHGHGHAV